MDNVTCMIYMDIDITPGETRYSDHDMFLSSTYDRFTYKFKNIADNARSDKQDTYTSYTDVGPILALSTHVPA